jgi:triosephosphate isomerase
MRPNIIIAESPDLIGVGERPAQDRQTIAGINEAVWAIDPGIRVLHGAGISNGQDVYNIISAGAQASGSTSGIIKAEDPFTMLEEMIRSVRTAWDETQ